MKMEQLFYLEDIADTLSITQSAQNFYITPQALNQQMKKLEEEFDIVLFERSNQGVTLTKDGYVFLQQTEIMRKTYHQLRAKMFCKNASIHPETFTVTSIKILSNARLLDILVPNFLADYMKQYPHLNFSVSEEQDSMIIEQVYKKEADFGIVLVPDQYIEYFKAKHLWANELSYSVIYSDCYVVCCNKNHPITALNEITLDDLNRFPRICYTEDSSISEFFQFEVATSSIMFTNNLLFHLKMIRRTDALSVATNLEARKVYHSYKDLITIPCSFFPQYNIVIVSQQQEQMSDIARYFINELKQLDLHA